MRLKMTVSANLGFPRIGAHRELKFALESYWKGASDAAALQTVAAELRRRHWDLQRDKGIAIIPSNDFSFYDHVLDTSIMLGAVPERFASLKTGPLLDLYFACARGTADAQAMEMTKWFDTNYHYIVPEFSRGQTFSLFWKKPVEDYLEAKALGIATRPVLLGPVSWLSLGKSHDADLSPLDLLDAVLPVYVEILAILKTIGAEWVEIDEPILSLDLNEAQRAGFQQAYKLLGAVAPKIMLTSYFGGLEDNLDLAAGLPVAGLHVDLVRAPDQLDDVLEALMGSPKILSLGLVDGRNIWRSNLADKLDLARRATDRLGSNHLQIAPSCSLLHSPVDLAEETRLDDELKSWLAFATQKLEEVTALSAAVDGEESKSAAAFAASAAASETRARSSRTANPAVRERASAVTAADLERHAPYPERRKLHDARFGLPAFPTTTIGSFPQTQDVRKARAAHKKGEMDDAAYEAFLKDKTEDCVRIQEDLGLDVLVHGEFERNDMVEYFGEQLDGFAFTKNGWVQSYGSRCVKPPIIYGDLQRPEPMTVKWSQYAQSLTEKPMKGMLTGPVTILQWSFVRDDQPRSETCRQIGLAIRDEVIDLEAAGIGMIQIDEPALREGLPLRKADWPAYLDWAVDCFKLSAGGVRDDTQIHTHMCYAEFNDIMPSIAALDADVISIETSRSRMELLSVFGDFSYPNEIGPGVWDIHSPRVPSREEMLTLMTKAKQVIPADRLWVNPDCGLKTRGWEEVKASLANLVATARDLRK